MTLTISLYTYFSDKQYVRYGTANNLQLFCSLRCTKVKMKFLNDWIPRLQQCRSPSLGHVLNKISRHHKRKVLSWYVHSCLYFEKFPIYFLHCKADLYLQEIYGVYGYEWLWSFNWRIFQQLAGVLTTVRL